MALKIHADEGMIVLRFSGVAPSSGANCGARDWMIDGLN